jgi:hypothetical protein
MEVLVAVAAGGEEDDASAVLPGEGVWIWATTDSRTGDVD